MLGSVQEIAKLSLVDAVVVDLLVMEPGGTDELVQLVLMEEFRAQARIRGERPVLGKPLRERPGTDPEAEVFLEVGHDCLACLAAIIAYEGIKNDCEREGFAFGDLRGKDPVAVMAPPELDGLEFFVALAFPGDAQAPTVEASLALLADELLVAGSGHVFLVAQGRELDKGALRIVHSLDGRCLPDSASMPPHGFCKDYGGFGRWRCDVREVGRWRGAEKNPAPLGAGDVLRPQMIICGCRLGVFFGCRQSE